MRSLQSLAILLESTSIFKVQLKVFRLRGDHTINNYVRFSMHESKWTMHEKFAFYHK